MRVASASDVFQNYVSMKCQYYEVLRSAVEFEFNDLVPVIKVMLISGVPPRIVRIMTDILNHHSSNHNSKFVEDYRSFLSGLLDCKNKRVRKNALHLLGVVGSDLSTIAGAVFDKSSSVRKQSLLLLGKHLGERLNDKTSVVNIFNDIIKHDQSPTIRILGISIMTKYYTNKKGADPSIVISRCEDLNTRVRKYFYFKCLPNIALKRDVNPADFHRLLVRSYQEREFNAVEPFTKKVKDEFNLCEFLSMVSTEMLKSADASFISSTLKSYFPSNSIRLVTGNSECSTGSTLTISLSDLDVRKTFLILEYCKFVDETLGRDELRLPPIEDFLKYVYNKCSKILVDKRMDDIMIVKMLFKLLGYYDLFPYLKIVQSMIYKLIGKNFVNDMLVDCISIPSIVNDVHFLKNLIKRNMESKNVIPLVSCIMEGINREFTDVHSELADAIMAEIAPNFDRKDTYGLIFYYSLIKPSEEYVSVLLKDITNTLSYLVDLYLSSALDAFPLARNEVRRYILGKIMDMDESMVVPACKIVLYDKSDGVDDMFVFIVRAYYSSDSDEIKQYLYVFLDEIHRINDLMFITNLHRLLDEISSKMFTEHLMFWCSGVYTDLVYWALVYVFKNPHSYERLRSIFSNTSMVGRVSSVIKKMLYCCNKITRKGLALGSFVEEIIGRDDGEPISRGDLEDVKRDLGLH